MMSERRSQAESGVVFSVMDDCVKRLGCALRSNVEMIHRLESNFSEQMRVLENLEQKFILLEKKFHRREKTIPVTMERDTEGSSSGSVEEKESKEDDIRLRSTSMQTSDTKMNLMQRSPSQLLGHRRSGWESEKEELIQKQNQLVEQIKSLREQLDRLRTKGERREKMRRIATNGSVNILDKTLFPIVIRCIVALGMASEKRRIESSCLLIQRIFRGHVVRKGQQQQQQQQLTLRHRQTLLIGHRPKVNGGDGVGGVGGEGSELESVSADDNCRPSPPKTKEDERTTDPPVTTQQQHNKSHRTTTTAEATTKTTTSVEDDDNNNTNEGSDDVIGDAAIAVTADDSDNGRRPTRPPPPPRKGSLPQLLQGTTKTKTSAASSSLSSSSSASLQQTNRRSWSVSSTTEWQDPTDIIVHGLQELKQLELFFAAKISKLKDNSKSGKSSIYDVVFTEALREFHSHLTTQLSPTTESDVDLGYKDLMQSFERELRARAGHCRLESGGDGDSFPYPLFVNAFRGFIDEFIKRKQHSRGGLIPDIKAKKDDHDRKTNKAKRNSLNVHSVAVAVAGGQHQQQQLQSSAVGFGQLGPSDRLIFVDRLIAAIESKGLCSVGLYRVAGNAGKIKQLIKDMTAAGSLSALEQQQQVFADCDLHVMASVLKTLFRQMPQPLITCDVYKEVLQLHDTAGEKRCESLDEAVRKLAEPNGNLLNKLITHLAKVAQHESSNRMSTNAIAIVFAPCLLPMPNLQQSALHENLSNIQRQTACLQFIIECQLEKTKSCPGSLTSPDDIDTEVTMDDVVGVTEQVRSVSTCSVTDTVDVTGDVTPDDVFDEHSRITDEATAAAATITESEAVTSDVVCSDSVEETDFRDVVHFRDRGCVSSMAHDSAANGVEVDGAGALLQSSSSSSSSVEEKAAATSDGAHPGLDPITKSTSDAVDLKSPTTDKKSIISRSSVNSHDSDLDFNVSFEDEDNHVKVTVQPNDDRNEGHATRADDNPDLTVMTQPSDQGEGQTKERVGLPPLSGQEKTQKDDSPEIAAIDVFSSIGF